MATTVEIPVADGDPKTILGTLCPWSKAIDCVVVPTGYVVPATVIEPPIAPWLAATVNPVMGLVLRLHESAVPIVPAPRMLVVRTVPGEEVFIWSHSSIVPQVAAPPPPELTVKGEPLLDTPLTLTTTFPVVAPVGTEVAMLVALQVVTEAVVPLKVTELVP